MEVSALKYILLVCTPKCPACICSGGKNVLFLLMDPLAQKPKPAQAISDLEPCHLTQPLRTFRNFSSSLNSEGDLKIRFFTLLV